jgi:hypothetical protein
MADPLDRQGEATGDTCATVIFEVTWMLRMAAELHPFNSWEGAVLQTDGASGCKAGGMAASDPLDRQGEATGDTCATMIF